jgi:hypothetical protein
MLAKTNIGSSRKLCTASAAVPDTGTTNYVGPLQHRPQTQRLVSLHVHRLHHYSFKVSLSESGITKPAPDQLGWIGMNGIPFWGGLNYEGTFTERGGVLN